MWLFNLFFVLLALGSIQADQSKTNNVEAIANADPYDEEIGTLMGRKLIRNFGVLQLGGGYGVAKRFSSSTNRREDKTEKHRRGPLNGLIPGGAFGRAARSNCIRTNCQQPFIYDKIMKFLKGPMNNFELQPYVSFDVGSRKDRDDGQGIKAFIDKGVQENIPRIDSYTPYQYSK